MLYQHALLKHVFLCICCLAARSPDDERERASVFLGIISARKIDLVQSPVYPSPGMVAEEGANTSPGTVVEGA